MKANKYLGNFLILSSLLIIAYTYYPMIQFFVPSTPETQVTSDNVNYVSIPKITAFAPIMTNIDPWNEKVYRKALEQGVAHAAGTSLPGEPGATYLFAHSSDAPWRMTRTNTAFLRLGELEPGDEVFVNFMEKKYRYKVHRKVEVWPNEVQHLKSSNWNGLILQTCTPVGTALKRLLIYAEPI